MLTFSRTCIAALALFFLCIVTASESVAERACIGRHCKRPAAQAPARPQQPNTTQPPTPQSAPISNLPDIPEPNLNDCHPRGHGLALTEYDRDVAKGMILIDSSLQEQAVMPFRLCSLLFGQVKENCCNQVKAAAIGRCQQGVEANAQADNKCAFVPPCQRKLLCPITWTVEEKRVQCCNSLKPQAIAFLKGYCATRIETMKVSCSTISSPSLPTPVLGVRTPALSDRNVTIE